MFIDNNVVLFLLVISVIQFRGCIESNGVTRQRCKIEVTKPVLCMQIQNNYLPLECISKINKRKNAKQISTIDFSTLHTEILHDKLLDILYKVVDLVFKGGTRDYIVINK